MGTSCPWIWPTTHRLPTLQVAKFPAEFRPRPSSHPPIPSRAFVIPKQVTPSNISLWQCRLGPAPTMIGHLGTPKDDHIASLPTPDWTKDASLPPRTKIPANGGWHMAAHQGIKVPHPPREPLHPFARGLTGHRSTSVSTRRHPSPQAGRAPLRPATILLLAQSASKG